MSKKTRGNIVIVLVMSAILLGLAVAYGDSSPSVTGVGTRFPTIVGSVKLEGEALQVAACGHYAFVASQDSGGYAMLEIVEFRDPTHPQLIKSIKLGEGTPTGPIEGIPYGIMTEGKFVYVGVRVKEHAEEHAEEHAFDVSNPENPNPQDFHEIPAGPRIRSSHELEGSSMRFENAVFRAGRGLQRDTLSAFFYRTRTGKSITIPTPGTAGDVFVIDDLLFIADGPIQGLTVMRLSPRPGLLPILGWVSTNTPGSAQAITVFGSLVLIADGMEGLSIIDFSPFPETGRPGPISPGSLVGVVDTPGEAVDVAAAGNVALVADSHEGLQIISLPSVQAQQVDKPKTIATGNKVIITGQLVRKDGSPVIYACINVYEFKDGKAWFKIGEGGIWLNPHCTIRREAKGRFKLELDLDVFKEAEEFVIFASFDPYPFATQDTQEVPLRDRNGAIITLKFSEPIKKLDLGEIVVE